MDIWISNRQGKLIQDEHSLKIGSNFQINMKDVIGLATHQKKPNGSKIYRLYTYKRIKKFMKSEQRYLNHK